ncbi:MotA/TolQ/ExbB proton channel family protein [Haemophilus paracuniculus]|uniref:MotA/TolQ/ExbB proton channel family protein n=1 Tax=Haemophilus paracuniculus TaxID=734 RepID=UPI000992DE81|nr:MotA/TolQ/ExbB proton channel family protein [Haemophilus paracuniculus]
MFISSFENFLKNLSSDIITNSFFFVLVSIFCIGLFTFFFRDEKERYRNFSEYAPVLLTSIGILGTFTGVVAGLLNFDVNDINGSITELLGGMKTAFLTSVIGLCFSILLKTSYTLLERKKSDQEDSEDLDIQMVVNKIHTLSNNSSSQLNLMQQLSENMQKMVNVLGSEADSSLLGQIKLLRSDMSDNYKQFKNELLPMVTNVENIAKSLGSDSDSSILGQVRLLRTDLLDNYKKFNPMIENIEKVYQLLVENKTEFDDFENKLWIKLQDFADMMSKSATEAVIEALKQVIQDFNNNLTEQFGENFKELNRAVMALIDWQENYKNQLNEMIALYNAGVQSLTVTESSIAKIEGSTQAIPTTMEKLSSVIATNQHQIDNLGNHLNSFAELRDKAIQAVPEIQNQISAMLSNMEKGNGDLIQSVKAGGEQLKQSLNQSAEQLSESFAASGNKFVQKLTDSSEEFAKTTRQANELISSNIENVRTTSQEIKVNLEATAKSMSDQQKVLNQEFKQMAEQITQFAQKWQNEFDTNTRQIQERFAQSIDEMMKKQLSENTRLMTRLEEENKKALATTGESVEKQLKLIDTSMETELKRVMEQMGTSLATISRKFTDDYKELVNRMVEITNYRGR